MSAVSSDDSAIDFYILAAAIGYEVLENYVRNQLPVSMVCASGHRIAMRPNDIKTGYRCRKCAGSCPVQAAEQYLRIAAERGYIVNGDYVNDAGPVSMTCPRGHTTMLRPTDFKQGHGCAPCAQRGATNQATLARAQNWALSACFLYVLRMWDVDGMPFLKVGLGGQKRINDHLRRHPDNTVLVQMASTRASCFDVEQLLLNTLQPSYRYEPVEHFHGWTECLTAAAPVGWLLAEVAHLLLDPEDDDAIEVAIQRTIDACVAEHERLSEES